MDEIVNREIVYDYLGLFYEMDGSKLNGWVKCYLLCIRNIFLLFGDCLIGYYWNNVVDF